MIKNKFSRSLFIFRRDLRLEDNTALIEACSNSSSVLTCFIFDPRQIDKHPYQSEFALGFLQESLMDLQQQLCQKKGKLLFFEGRPDLIVRKLIDAQKLDAVYVNRDYTPFSVTRDLAIQKVCQEAGVEFQSIGDALLHEPSEISKGSGGPYTIFTPFYRKCQTLKIRSCRSFQEGSLSDLSIQGESKDWARFFKSAKFSPSIKGGRQKAMTILKGIAVLKDYQVKRDIPSLDATSHLSSHHKFGTVSIREVYHAAVKHLGRDHTLVQELHWRDFFTHIAHHFPYVFGQSFDDRYEQLPWSQDQKRFKAWCDGLTGFPIVDAGMRQLNTTGFMHNRVRMITASFLVKDLHIDWKWGERYFASKLVDYDPAVNNGNWQWAASTGCDHQPYFRIFNPWLQQKRFDPECLYIKKWVEELKDVPVPVIHSWHEEHVWKGAYLKPMVDHSKQAEAAKQMFKMIKGSAED